MTFSQERFQNFRAGLVGAMIASLGSLVALTGCSDDQKLPPQTTQQQPSKPGEVPPVKQQAPATPAVDFDGEPDQVTVSTDIGDSREIVDPQGGNCALVKVRTKDENRLDTGKRELKITIAHRVADEPVDESSFALTLFGLDGQVLEGSLVPDGDGLKDLEFEGMQQVSGPGKLRWYSVVQDEDSRVSSGYANLEPFSMPDQDGVPRALEGVDETTRCVLNAKVVRDGEFNRLQGKLECERAYSTIPGKVVTLPSAESKVEDGARSFAQPTQPIRKQKFEAEFDCGLVILDLDEESSL